MTESNNDTHLTEEWRSECEFHLKLAWDYFALHASQRMALFNYFLFIAGIILAGLAACLKGTQQFSALGIFIGLILALISLIFFKLDARTTELIKHAEVILESHEIKYFQSDFRIFSLQRQASPTTRNHPFWGFRIWSYSECFRLAFLLMGLSGITGAALSTLRFFGSLNW